MIGAVTIRRHRLQKLLAVNPETVRRWQREGSSVSVRVGGELGYPGERVREYLASQDKLHEHPTPWVEAAQVRVEPSRPRGAYEGRRPSASLRSIFGVACLWATCLGADRARSREEIDASPHFPGCVWADRLDDAPWSSTSGRREDLGSVSARRRVSTLRRVPESRTSSRRGGEHPRLREERAGVSEARAPEAKGRGQRVDGGVLDPADQGTAAARSSADGRGAVRARVVVPGTLSSGSCSWPARSAHVRASGST